MCDMPVPADDSSLLDRIARRDPAGIALLYDRYGALAFALAYRLLSDRGAAEDVVQGAFLAVWRRAGTYDATRGTARAWLLTIVHHQAIDALRSRRARGGVMLDIDRVATFVGDHDTATTVERGLEGERVRAALATLPADQRQVVDLAYFGGLTHSEIAARIGIPLGTVKGRMRLALGKLRGTLQGQEGIGDQSKISHE